MQRIVSRRLPKFIEELREKPLESQDIENALAIARADIDGRTDEEEAAIVTAALSDPDNPPWEERERRRAPGRPRLAAPKRSVHLRLDADVIEAFAAGGKGWQTRMNGALRKAAGLE